MPQLSVPAPARKRRRKTTPDIRAAVAELRLRGFAVCRIPTSEKNPVDRSWTTRSAEPDDFAPGHQVGILGGPLSHGGRPGHALVVLDLDAADAVARADEYLPPTGMIDGRDGKPRSHRYYLVPVASIPRGAHSRAAQAAKAAVAATGHPGPFTKSFRHRETRAEVLKFIGTGGQCVAPPSVHHSGERRVWADGAPGEPAAVPFADLWAACGFLAAACGWSAATSLPLKWRRSVARPFGGRLEPEPVPVSDSQVIYSTCKLDRRTLPPVVCDAVRRARPRAPGERNERLWDLARELKTVVPDPTVAELRAAFELWWAEARRVVRTKDQELSWRALEDAWPRAYPIGRLERARRAADATDGSPRFKLLAGCHVLAALSPHGPFDLSCRAAGAILGVSHVAGAKHIKRLVDEKHLIVAAPGDPSPVRPRATTYALGTAIRVDDWAANAELEDEFAGPERRARLRAAPLGGPSLETPHRVRACPRPRFANLISFSR